MLDGNANDGSIKLMNSLNGSFSPIDTGNIRPVISLINLYTRSV